MTRGRSAPVDDASPRPIEVEGTPEDDHARSALAASFALRRAVFVDEQGVPEALEWDGLDRTSRHFVVLARASDSTVASASGAAGVDRFDLPALGTARMRRIGREARAERVAVRADARGLGIGRRLMRALEDRARLEGLAAVVLHAQLAAVPFYAALGYTAHGEVFVEAGIDHRAMSRRLD